MLDNREAPLGAVAAAREVATLGSTVLRGAWPPAKLAVLREAIAAFTARRAARVAGGSMTPHERMYAVHGVGTYTYLLAEKLIDLAYLRDLFVGSAFHDLCKAYFDDDALFVIPMRLGFRTHDPKVTDRSFIPFHQDSYTQDVRTPRVLNCWIPLDPGAGAEAPGLEVVRDPCRPNFPRKDFGLRSENAAYDFITIDRDRIVEEYGERFWAPVFDVGDGLVFSEDVIHRTHATPSMTRPRMNFELRVFSETSLKPGVTPADLTGAIMRLC